MNAPLVVENRPPNLLLRVIWFILVGWWLGGIVSAVAWFLNLTIIGLPLGLWIINRLPTMITLRPQEQRWTFDGERMTSATAQRPFILRALFFLLIGWWLSGLWIAAAYAALMTVILLPLAFWMYGQVGTVTTLYRS